MKIMATFGFAISIIFIAYWTFFFRFYSEVIHIRGLNEWLVMVEIGKAKIIKIKMARCNILVNNTDSSLVIFGIPFWTSIIVDTSSNIFGYPAEFTPKMGWTKKVVIFLRIL